MGVVDGDGALPDPPQARSVAGTLIVHKIAGALAEQGTVLDAITPAAQSVIKGVRFIGMSLGTCTLPGPPKQERIGAGKVDLVWEFIVNRGGEQEDFTVAADAMAMVVDRLDPPLEAAAMMHC